MNKCPLAKGRWSQKCWACFEILDIYVHRKEPKKENKHVLEIVQVTTHGIWIVPVGKKHPV